MKILFINPIGELGGAERSLLDSIWSLKRHDPSLQLELLSFAPGPLLGGARDLGIPADVLALPAKLQQLGESLPLKEALLKTLIRSPAALAFAARLRRVVARSGADILHTNGLKAHVLTALARMPDQKLLWHVHDFVSWRPIMRHLLPRLSGRADAAIAISQAVASDMHRILPLLPIEVVLNGIRTEDFERGRVAPLDLDALAGLPPSPAVRIGLIATYAHWKGHELFLEAAARVNDPSLRYYIIGGPVYMSRASQLSESLLRERIAALRLEGHVGLLPFQREPASVYSALDIVVHASTKPEPFGRTVAEGMAAGCALVASAEGGPLEQIRDRIDGLLFKPRDVESLASNLKLLAENSALRRQFAKAAALRARTDLHADRIGPKVTAIYESLLTRSRSSAARQASASPG